MTVLAQLVAEHNDSLDYVTYVFKCLEDDVAILSRYIMCIRYPNWDHRRIELEEVGYLTFEEIRAGVDKWYDGENMIPYKYNTIQFINFIEKPNSISHEYVI